MSKTSIQRNSICCAGRCHLPQHPQAAAPTSPFGLLADSQDAAVPLWLWLDAGPRALGHSRWREGAASDAWDSSGGGGATLTTMAEWAESSTERARPTEGENGPFSLLRWVTVYWAYLSTHDGLRLSRSVIPPSSVGSSTTPPRLPPAAAATGDWGEERSRGSLLRFLTGAASCPALP